MTYISAAKCTETPAHTHINTHAHTHTHLKGKMEPYKLCPDAERESAPRCRERERARARERERVTCRAKWSPKSAAQTHTHTIQTHTHTIHTHTHTIGLNGDHYKCCSQTHARTHTHTHTSRGEHGALQLLPRLLRLHVLESWVAWRILLP